MKKVIHIKNKSQLSIYMLILMISSVFFSCQEDDTGPAVATGAPSIERVSLAEKDSTTNVGLRENLYIIHGRNLATTQKVFFNETEAYFNPTLVTNSSIIVAIPGETPYFNASDELRVETSSGSATLPFAIAQPPPNITAFEPLAAAPGEIVTITGTVFEGLQSVWFGELEATVVSATFTEIQVLVPEGIVQEYIYVETAGGITQAESVFGFAFVLYDDQLAPGWWVGGWGGTQDFESTTQVKRGEYAIERNYDGGYGGFQIGNGGAPIQLEEFSAVKVSIYGGPGIVDIKIVINGNFDDGFVITIPEGEWIDLTIPFDQLGNPSGTLNEVVIQEFSGSVPSLIYIDDLGFI
ncbi:MAG: IPT/TIG domain-containing protein [Bacteroidota bacterium]